MISDKLKKWVFEKTSERQVVFWGIGIAILSAAFLVLKMFTINAYVGDEHIYLFQGKLVSQGLVPYRDFAMAHPPLQAAFTALLFKLFGYHFMLGRMLPIFIALAGGLTLSVLVFREFGAVASVVATAFVFFSYEPLRASSHYTGVNMTWALLVGALLAYRTNAFKTCAILCVAAVFTRLYAAPFVAAIIIWAIIADFKRGLKIIVWGAGVSGALIIAGCLWAGPDNIYNNLLGYHAGKTPMTTARLANDKASVLFHNALPAILYLLSLPVLAVTISTSWNKRSKHSAPLIRFKEAITEARARLPIFCAISAGLYVLMLSSMDRVWMYYFVPVFPFAAIFVGYAASRWTIFDFRISKSKIAGGLVLLVIFVTLFIFSPRLEQNLRYWDKEIKKPAAERTKTYSWHSALLPDFLNDLVKATLWSDERTIGEEYSFYNYYLWHESRFFDKADKIAEEIRARTQKDECIFGDSGSVPLLALLSDRCIAGNEVDTNIQRYKSGAADPAALIKKIDKASTKIIVLRPRFGVGALPHLKKLIRNKYTLVRMFRTAQGRVFIMYERK